MESLIHYNGNIIAEKDAIISINNRSFRYGDGCFETIKVINGKIILPQLHFSRLLSSLEKLQFEVPEFLTAEYLTQELLQVVDENKHSSLARVRITAFRGDGNINEEVSNVPNLSIQSFKGSDVSNHLNQKGVILDFYTDAKKTCDNFSSVKSNNYLASVMGSLHAKKNQLDDCIIPNCFNRVAETTIANIFIIKEGTIKTPPLTEGCVDGVMRKYLISCFKNESFPFEESEITLTDIHQASEVFLTNAVFGIKWVSKVGNNSYSNQLSSMLHKKFIDPLFNPTF